MTSDIRSIYVTALKNTHAVEMQALQIMERQVERLERYPEMEQALRPPAGAGPRVPAAGPASRRHGCS